MLCDMVSLDDDLDAHFDDIGIGKCDSLFYPPLKYYALKMSQSAALDSSSILFVYRDGIR